MTRVLALVATVFFTYSAIDLWAQPDQRIERAPRLTAKRLLAESSQATGIAFDNIGPDIFSGRVVDLEVNPANSTHFLVAFATGGLWETTNNGRSFTELFEEASTYILGDIAVDWTRRHIWVGTGENNSSRSSYAGNGIYLSKDWGQSWDHVGLDASHHIGRILLLDERTVLAAALGPLYAEGGQRGVYRSSDYGATWSASLATEGAVGAIDLLADPLDPATVYAATWERERKAWNFTESGPGSTIYKSTDAGETWQRAATGFPQGEHVGRIGLSASSAAGAVTLYAVLDNQQRRPVDPADEGKLTRLTLGDMTGDVFATLDDELLEKELKDLGFPTKKYPVDSLKREVKAGRLSPKLLADYLTDANAQLFDTPVVGAELYASTDGGQTWSKTHEDYLDDVYYSYGYYFGQVRSHPTRPEEVYIFGVPALRSLDGGATWKGINDGNVHADHHALYIDPQLDGHLIIGNDGGVNISYDYGDTYTRAASPPAGQFYAVAVDNAQPYRVYGGTQDNGVWRGPSRFDPSTSWELYGNTPYEHILGGDGMQVQVDPRDNETVYTGFQFGNYSRIDPDGKHTDVQPKHKLGERPLRFNWQTPIHLSRHNADVFYIGSNKFHRSLDQGNSYDITSEDLTKGGRPGDVPYGTLTTIHESPLRFGLLYVGTDDGMVHRSNDGGYTWTNISRGLPVDKWVSRVQASHHELDRVYLTLNGYRDDDFKAYVYLSENGGKSWRSIAAGLPMEPVNDILEDSQNPDLLYLATDGGLYYSDSRGGSWHTLGDLAPVPVHDLVIQEREEELLVGTHGKSLYIGDVALLRTLEDSVGSASLYVYTPAVVKYNERWGKSWSRWFEPDTPRVELPIFAVEPTEALLTVSDSLGRELQTKVLTLRRGLNYVDYNLTASAAYAEEHELEKAQNEVYYLQPGRYIVEVASTSARGGAGETATSTLIVEDKQE